MAADVAADSGANPVLTDAQREYLNRKGDVVLCTAPDWLPISNIDKNGKHEGIVADLLDEITRRAHFSLKLLRTDSWSETLSDVWEGKCDVLSTARMVPGNNVLLNYSSVYFSFPSGIITRADQPYIVNINGLMDKTFVLVKGSTMTGDLRAHYPDMKIELAADPREALEHVRKGIAYGYVDLLPSMQFLLQSQGIRDLKINGQLGESWDLAIGIRKDEPMLRDIIQSALESIPRETQQHIVARWIGNTPQPAADNGTTWFAAGSLTVTLIAIFVAVLRLRRLRRQVADANLALVGSRIQMGEILDLFEEGVLSFGGDLKIGPDASAACFKIFGMSVAGRRADHLLFGQDARAAQWLADLAELLAKGEDRGQQEAILSLLPTHIDVGARHLRVKYRLAGDNRVIVLVAEES